MFFSERTWLRAWSPVILIVVGVAFLLGGAIALQPFLKKRSGLDSNSVLFAASYPVAPEFLQELKQLRTSARLKSQDEAQINYAIETTSEALQIPTGVLWCLLFQESRLNHLEGINESRSASGIGQFSYFSFYEINHHLDRFTQENRTFFISWFGRDIRPISAGKVSLSQPSSYYFIPTGVAASAAYLNNRYHHLEQILIQQQIPYDKELLWLYAAMAYNKGTRSVLSFWNIARKKGGMDLVTRLTSDSTFFLNTIQKPQLTERALASIWTKKQAPFYARELRLHMKNLERCAVINQASVATTVEPAS